MKEISIEKMLEAGVHFGHSKEKWNPKMKPYIFGRRETIHIIDLLQTYEKLKEALNFVADIAAKGGKILFVGTKRQARDLVKKAAELCSMPYVNERWLGGTFTNFETIKKQIEKLKDLEEKEKTGEFKKYTKKEQLVIKEEIDKLKDLFGGLSGLDKLPEAIFIVDIVRDHTPVTEARKIGIPIIALVDTNANPELVDYPIPANDDAVKAIELMCNVVAETILENYKKSGVSLSKEKIEKEKKSSK